MERVGGLARLVCGRWTKWIVVIVWLAFVGAMGPLAGKLTGIQQNDTAQWLPSNAEATRVVELQKQFQTTETFAAVIVYERASGTTQEDQAKVDGDAAKVAKVDGISGDVIGPLRSDDGQALELVVPIAMGQDGYDKIAGRVDAIRDATAGAPAGLAVHITGPAGNAADNAEAFSGVDGALLFVTVLVVIVLLLLIYRSPTLWVLPVASAGIALTAAQGVIYAIANGGGFTVNAQSVGILTVLVFGAGTDYALLLVARYREELRRHADRHQAMAVALHRAGPAIIASAATVAIALLCTTFADMNSTQGLGPVTAIGVAVALLAMVTLLPALLVIFGRWLFWPVKPKVGTAEPASTGRWARLGNGIARRPRPVWMVTALALGALALGLFALNANGLSTEDSFINKPDSVVGQEVAGKHFPAGHGQPVIVVGNAGAATQLSDAVRNTDGITEVAEPVTKNGLVSIEGTVIAQPDSDAAKATVNRVRDAVHAVPGADAKVGGQTAMIIDMDRATNHDNQVIIPLVLLVVLLILGLLLRAIVAPLVLIATVVLSFGAALGVSALLFQAFGFNGADSSFPLFVFVFLVALGIDYNIFLVSRIREEAKRQGTKRGVITGLSATGGVITSAGLVLAATFGVLASLPMVFFAELGIAVAVGILLDTFIVRSILVTALNLDLDRRMWWPSKLSAKQSAVSGPDRDEDKDKEPALAN